METRLPERRTGLFIGACGGTVAAATPEMRFDWRISERSAERTEHWPLTLMNSARCARRPARAKTAAPERAAEGIGWWRRRTAALPAVTVFRGEALPQDPCASKSVACS